MEDILGIDSTTAFNYCHTDRHIILFYFKINEDGRFYVGPSELKQTRLIAGFLSSMLCCRVC
jgi:hypothetical protein